MLNLFETSAALGLGRVDGLDQLARSRKARNREQRFRLRRKYSFLQANIPFTTVALTGTTAKTAVSAAAAANQVIKILSQRVSFDGATSTNAPALIESGRCTFGGAGTSTSVTPSKLDPGRAETIQTTGAKNYSAEPTTITPIDPADVPQYNGFLEVMTPDSRPNIVVGGQGWVIRITSPTNVNTTGKLVFEE
jgi:hypothetical protein